MAMVAGLESKIEIQSVVARGKHLFFLCPHCIPFPMTLPSSAHSSPSSNAFEIIIT